MKILITSAVALSLLPSFVNGDLRRHRHAIHGDAHDLKKRSNQCQFPTNAGLVAVTPNEQNAGWAMSPDQPCKPGMYCPYACPAGQVGLQWDPKATSYSYPISQNGGLYCNEDGKIEKPFPKKDYCADGTGSAHVKNTCGNVISFCQTVLPGNEAMLIPTEIHAGKTEIIAVPDPSYWVSTAAHYYINAPGVGVEEGCVWGTKANPIGNWSPYVAGANADASGNTFVKIGWNPVYLESDCPFKTTLPNFGLRLVCKGSCVGLPCEINPKVNGVNEVTSLLQADGAGGGAFCVGTAQPGSHMYIEVFEVDEGSSTGVSSSDSTDKIAAFDEEESVKESSSLAVTSTIASTSSHEASTSSEVITSSEAPTTSSVISTSSLAPSTTSSAEPSTSSAEPSISSTESSTSSVESSISSVESTTSSVESTTSSIESITSSVESTTSSIASSTSSVESTSSSMESSTSSVESSTSSIESSTSSVESSTSSVESSTSSVESSTSSVESSTSSVESSTSSVESSTSSIESSTSVQPSTSSSELTTSSVLSTSSAASSTVSEITTSSKPTTSSVASTTSSVKTSSLSLANTTSSTLDSTTGSSTTSKSVFSTSKNSTVSHVHPSTSSKIEISRTLQNFKAKEATVTHHELTSYEVKSVSSLLSESRSVLYNLAGSETNTNAINQPTAAAASVSAGTETSSTLTSGSSTAVASLTYIFGFVSAIIAALVL
ncbi:hypothetical protein D0Z00_000915 [Geotrichum galactomycetum]|uniref:Uncharacterized protein n=1 Tax=Geotrichum galactomycetum TaxID=27317 RepID=A0ACB6V8P0_9ASCO|nr:hypothetical protein D0Z00_000915 [Geotrichum candidum]